MKVYGITNCNTVKKALDWFKANNVAYEFHDFKKLGVSADKLNEWADKVGYEKVMNKQGLTYRGLDDDRCRDRLPRSALRRQVPHHADRGADLPARGRDRGADAAPAPWRLGVVTVPRVALAPGYTVSRVVKGGWQLAGGHGAIDRARAVEDMAAFVDAGVTSFDCADIYTGVESLIGDVLTTRAPGDVQVHTKCVPDLDRLAALESRELDRIVARSRDRLGVEALDLVQFHWWDYMHGDWMAALEHLAALRARGWVRHLGITNFDTPSLARMLDAGLPIVSHQVQYSLLDRRPAAEMAPLALSRGVGLLCYGALAGGFLGERWLGHPEPSEPLENRSLVKYRLIIEETGGWSRFQELLALLRGIGQAHGVGIGAVAVAWVLAQPAVSAVIAGARDRSHLADTVAGANLQLAPDACQAIDAFLAGTPVPPGDVYELERDREGRHGRIMRYGLNATG